MIYWAVRLFLLRAFSGEFAAIHCQIYKKSYQENYLGVHSKISTKKKDGQQKKSSSIFKHFLWCIYGLVAIIISVPMGLSEHVRDKLQHGDVDIYVNVLVLKYTC